MIRKLIRRVLHFFMCLGPVVGQGHVKEVKGNAGGKIIPGLRKIHKCSTCGDYYARDPDDLIGG